VLHQIGIGTLGPVFRTYEPTRDRLVAVKVFRLDIVPEQAQALADALSRATRSSLFHPSIVEPIAAGVEGTLAYRAEEYVAAESLDVAMRHYAPAPLDKALPFITQLAGAIDFARAAGVGHGGLHPRDIFVTPDEARATGFGVVEALEEVGIRAPIRRPYSALERIDGIKWGTPADVFSLAAITFELLTGRRPAGTGAEIGALPTGPHSYALHAVLARAMDDEPSRRYQSALAFAGALESAGRGEQESAAASDLAAIAMPAAVPASKLPAAAPVEVDPTPLPVVALPAEASANAAAPTPGEFEVEQDLAPAGPEGLVGEDAAAFDDVAAERDLDEADVAERTLFDAAAQALDENANDDIEGEALADLGEDVPPERFADDFTEEREPAASPIEDPPYVPAPVDDVQDDVSEVTMFAAADTDPDPDLHNAGERSRPVILPFALGIVIGLLAGFGPGYFVGSRDRVTPPAADAAPAAATTTAPQPDAGAPTGPATPLTPGQYSEQKVTPPPPVADAPPAPVADAPPPAARPAAAARGRLVVRSTPSRAGVTVNGTWRGRTPLTLDELAFGSYVVRVVQPGYRPARDEFTLSARDGSHEFTARLERVGRAAATPAPKSGAGRAAPAAPAATVFTGTLYVDSRPRGATVFLDNRSVGQTPLSLPEVSIGTHVVRLEMAGKKSWSTTTRVVAGATARVTGSLDDK
jgi:hypothetical protein